MSIKRWTFQNTPNRPALSTMDVSYWKRHIERVLKVGIELEMNLPDKKPGACSGRNSICPCEKLNNGCERWKECIGCDAPRIPETCAVATAICEREDCETCTHYSLKCHGIECSGFVSFCTICQDFVQPCRNCVHWTDPEKDPDTIRASLISSLQPNSTYAVMNRSGVCGVTTDGSLLGGQGKNKGVEIITNGRRVNYNEFYAMARGIVDRAAAKGAFVDERCSTHMHVLTGHLKAQRGEHLAVNELERPVPEIVALNFHQLCRLYQNAVTWMTSGLDNPDGLTRWEKYRVSIIDVDAQKSLSEISETIAGKCCKSKYGWANWIHTRYAEGGNIETLHVEMRAADGLMSPSAIAAIACLYYAMVIKAVEMSKFGVLALNDQEWHKNAGRIKNALLNGNGNWDDIRISDTSGLEKYYPELREQSLRLCYQLKNILMRLGPAYDVLEKLAVEPCSLRRCSGKSWADVEAELVAQITEEDSFETALVEVLYLVQISGMKSIEEWTETASEKLSVTLENAPSQKEILNYIVGRKNNGEVVWSEKVGAPLLV